jgi:hypothetical protein
LNRVLNGGVEQVVTPVKPKLVTSKYRRIKVITKLPNSEQSYKGKVKTHNYINRQNQTNRLVITTILHCTFGSDLTTKNKQYISLTSCDHSSLANIKVNFEGIITILDSYPACTLTFLEIPVYSIYELNKSKVMPFVNQFKEQDEQLLSQIHSLNEYIRHLNSRTEKISPNVAQDLSHKKSNKSKNKHSLTSDNYNFQLYRDGVHPHPKLARTWMRKLAVKIRDECWC